MNELKSISVGIHQPNFMPWIGYFIKMNESDHFIFHDAAEFSKNSLIRRTFIRKDPYNQSRRYLAVPLQKHSDYAPIHHIKIVDEPDWIEKNKSIIKNNYHHTPYYKVHEDLVHHLISMAYDYEYFAEYSIKVLQIVAKELGIQCTFHRSSQLNVEGTRSRLNINLIKSIGGNTYNSGMGAKKYQNKVEFEESGIQLRYINVPNYLNNLDINTSGLGYSIIELLFCEGIESLKNIIEQYESDTEV